MLARVRAAAVVGVQAFPVLGEADLQAGLPSFSLRCLPGILPLLSFDEALETARIHSVAGLVSAERPLGRRRQSMGAER